jgi:hypothetical protein
MRYLIMIGLLLSGCVFLGQQTSKTLPGDFEVSYGYGACMAEMGRTNIEIDAQGNGIYEKGSGPLGDGGRFQNEEFRETFTLSDEERLALLNEIEKSGFFSLQDQYYNPDIVDGGCSAIFVTKDNVTKSVSVSNTKAPDAFLNAADSIGSAARSKTQ